MASVPGNPMKITAEAYPAARIVFYEDGLHTYLPQEDYHLSAARCLKEPRQALVLANPNFTVCLFAHLRNFFCRFTLLFVIHWQIHVLWLFNQQLFQDSFCRGEI